MYFRANVTAVEWIFFEILCLYFLSICASVNCWKFVPPDVNIQRSWAMATDGQDICEYKKYKQRYYVCKQATKTKITGGKFMFSKKSLGKAEEMEKEDYECTRKPKTVYFNLQYKDTGEYVKASRHLFTCPTTDPDGQKYFFSRGRNDNEIGIYKLKRFPKTDTLEYCFEGIMKDIDLEFFGNTLLKFWHKTPLLNLFAPQ